MQLDGGTLYPQIKTQLPSFIQSNHTQFTSFIEKYYEFLELNLLTFNDLNLNEDKIIQEVDNVTYTVTVATGNNVYSNSANKFYIGGETSPTLNVSTGITYIFDQSNSTNEGHLLRISTTPDGRHTPDGEEYSNGVNVVAFGTPGTAGAQTSLYVSPDISNTYLYYYCNNHSGMGGTVSVANGTPYISLENGNVTSTNTNPNFLDLENPNRQGEQFLSGETVEGSTSGAQGIVKGKFSTTQAWIEETNKGNFELGEKIVGQTSRVSANVTSYTRNALNASRNLPHFQDIDKAPAGFVELFRKEFLQSVPKNVLADKGQILKNIKDFYRAKGNEDSYKYIFRILYGKEDVSFYYPSSDMLRLSDGRWTLDKTIKIDNESANNIGSFTGRRIVGELSNVSALVERTITYQVGATEITELYLSSIDANNASYNANTDSPASSFYVNEEVKTTVLDSDGQYAFGNTTGILSGINIVAGGSNYSVGDELQLSGGGGKEAKVKVSSVTDATISTFNITDSGDGYSVGDAISFFNEGTGGSGGSARIQSIVKTANVFIDSQIINTFKEDKINSTAYTAPLDSVDANTHLSSNSTTTFSATASGTGSLPKKGDLLFYAERGGLAVENELDVFVAEAGCPSGTHTDRSTCNADTSSPGHASGGNNWPVYGGQNFDREEIATISTYDADSATYGTVVNVSGTTVTYALGSIYMEPTGGVKTLRNFSNGLTVDIYDSQKDGTGSPMAANGYNAVMGDTGSNMIFGSTPAAVTSNTHHGGLVFTEHEIGAIRSVQVLSSGQGYTSIPLVSVANNKIESYKNNPFKIGANSIFLTLASSIANEFTPNTIIKNSDNSASATVLDFIDKPTDLVATGNTVLRVQMSSTEDFNPSDIITSYNSDLSVTGIGDLSQANVSVGSTGSPAVYTATFTQSSHGFVAGQKIVVSGSTSGTDGNKYNNTHTIASVPNTSTYTVTFPAVTDTSETNLNIRRVVTANLAASNTIFANTGIAGNNAVISISSIAIGAIQTLSIYDFGAGYTSAPTLNASEIGDGTAILTGELGCLAEYDGYFAGPEGVLSGQNKLQDNYYYQDFSYVIKTDIDTATYRNKVLDLVHPSGLAMFGEVAMYQNADARMWGGNTENKATANTSMVANTTGVPQHRIHQISLANQNTASQNNRVTVVGSLHRPTPVSLPADGRVKFPSMNFDLVLEHENAGIGMEDAGNTIGYEDGDTLVLDDGGSRIEFEDFEASIIQENGSNLELEDGSFATFYSIILEDSEDVLLMEESTDVYGLNSVRISLETSGSEGIKSKNYLLTEPSVDGVQILSDDDHDIFQIISENDHDEFLIELEGTVQGFMLAEDDSRILGYEITPNPPNRIVYELDEVTYAEHFVVTERKAYEGFSIPKIQFPEAESGAIHIDMGFGSQLRLETDTIGSINLEYSVVKNFLSEDGKRLMTEAGEELIFVDDDTLMQEQGETGDLLLEDNLDNGLVLLESQPDLETEGFDFELLVLEGADGAFPVYLAMEDSMTDEIIKSHEIHITPMYYDEDPKRYVTTTNQVVGSSENIPFVVAGYDGAEDQTWTTEGGDTFVYETFSSGQSKASMFVRNEVDLPYGTGRSSSFSVKAQGYINAVGGEDYELLTEDGDTYVTESTGAEIAPRLFLTEDGDIYVLEHDSNARLADTQASELDITRKLIIADYDRQPSVTGTGTNFDQDFNAPIVLEDDDDTLVFEGSSLDSYIDGHRIMPEHEDLRPFGTEQTDNTTSYITLEISTDDSDLILIEGHDRSFEPLQDEDGNNIALEITGTYGTRRLLYNELLEVDIEEESVALEEDFKVLQEENTSGPGFTFLAENGDNLRLEQHAGYYASEPSPILNIAFDLKIEDFIGNIALEGDNTADSILLESDTPTGIGIVLISENGDRLIPDGQSVVLEENILYEDNDLVRLEGDEGGFIVLEVLGVNLEKCKFFLSENSFASTYSEGQIKVTNDKRASGDGIEEPQDFILESGPAGQDNNKYLVDETGRGFDTESLSNSLPTIHIELQGALFPHGVEENNSRIVFADGETAVITKRTDDHILEADYGAILLEDGLRTEGYLVSEDEFTGEGNKFKLDYGNQSLQNYLVEYGRHTQGSTIGEDRYLKIESETPNPDNRGWDYLFEPGRWRGGNSVQPTDTSDPSSGQADINLEEFTARIGNDILFEDLGQILTEDGEVNENDINAIMLEDDTYLTFEENDSLVLEDNHWNHKFLNIESARHRIEYVANSTFMKFTNETHDFTNLPFRVNHLEQVPA